MAINFKAPILQHINFYGHPIEVLRLDTIHPVVSGNKWYKLKGYLQAIQQQGLAGFVTFGGAYSNHLHAAAFAARALGMRSVGVIRGEIAEKDYSETLKACKTLGMHLHFVSRTQYQSKADAVFLEDLSKLYPNMMMIPEGGSGFLGQMFTQEIAQQISTSYDIVAVSVGSGTTITGLSEYLNPEQQLWGFVPMKNGKRILDGMAIVNAERITLIDEYHFGGFGKRTDVLVAYMNELYEKFQLPTDVVYTSKMFWGLRELLQKEQHLQYKKILAIHSGGLQGNNSIADKLVF